MGAKNRAGGWVKGETVPVNVCYIILSRYSILCLNLIILFIFIKISLTFTQFFVIWKILNKFFIQWTWNYDCHFLVILLTLDLHTFTLILFYFSNYLILYSFSLWCLLFTINSGLLWAENCTFVYFTFPIAIYNKKF